MKFRWWLLLLTSACFFVTLLLYPMLPPVIATHWGVNGQVDGTSGKITQLFIAALPLGIYILMVLIPRIDPRKENYALHSKAYNIFQAVLAIYLVGINMATLAYNFGIPLDIKGIVVVSLGILMAVLGNYMGQFRHNYFCGIRTPWTLANEEVWRRTHRFGGKLYVGAGILIVFSVFLEGTLSFAITMGSIILAALISVVYSYFVFRDVTKKSPLVK